MLHLDTSVQTLKTDDQGNLILDSDQRPISTAFDIVTGKQYEKVCPAVNGKTPKEVSEKQDALAADGCVHFASTIPGFHGWWKPIDDAPAAAPTASSSYTSPIQK